MDKAKLTMPSRSLLDGKPYTPADRTDVRALFERIRREQERQQIKTPFDEQVAFDGCPATL